MYHKISKVHKPLFYLLILLLPTQIGRHFWPDRSFVRGIRLDYLSPTIYLTDIIIIGLIISWLLPKLKKFKKFKIDKIHTYLRYDRRSVIHVFFVFLFLVLNILLASNQPAAFLKLLKLLELFLLALYIKKNFAISQFRNFAILFSLTLLYSSIIAWLQFIKQSSIGGIFWFLGERTFNIATPGIATVILNGQMLLRPYATFPHPNVLAGYLTTLLPFLLFYPSPTWLKSSRKAQKPKSNLAVQQVHSVAEQVMEQWLRIPLIFLSLSAIFITSSRSAWLVTTSILLAAALKRFFSWKLKSWKRKIKIKTSPYLRRYSVLSMYFFSLLLLLILLILFSSSLLLLSYFQSSTPLNHQSLSLRRELNKVALAMLKNHPLTGVGLNNFLVQLPNYRIINSYQDLQPAHNIYLLVTAETGLIGLGIFLWIIFKAYQPLLNSKHQAPNSKQYKRFRIWNLKNWDLFGIWKLESGILLLFLSLTSLLFLGLFDHYFFTLQQTQLLFAIILGLTYSKIPKIPT